MSCAPIFAGFDRSWFALSAQKKPLDPEKFIAALIPPPRRHRHHYHEAFAPNSPLRPSITTAAIQTSPKIVPPAIGEVAQKTSKISFIWAKLIARIYEVDPLLCLCGKEMKIV